MKLLVGIVSTYTKNGELLLTSLNSARLSRLIVQISNVSFFADHSSKLDVSRQSTYHELGFNLDHTLYIVESE